MLRGFESHPLRLSQSVRYDLTFRLNVIILIRHLTLVCFALELLCAESGWWVNRH